MKARFKGWGEYESVKISSFSSAKNASEQRSSMLSPSSPKAVCLSLFNAYSNELFVKNPLNLDQT